MVDPLKYEASIKKHQRQAKIPKRWLWIIFVFYFGSIAISGVAIFVLHMVLSEGSYYDSSDEIYREKLSILYINVFLLGGLGLFVIFRYKEIINQGKAFINKHNRRLKDAKDMSSVYPLLTEISTKLNVSPDILILPTTSRVVFPSIEKYNDKEVLILPLGFMSFLTKNPDQGRFILAHELSHIRQKDLSLFRQSEAFGKVLLPLILIIQVLSLLLKGFFLSGSLGELQTATDFLKLFIGETLTILCVIVASTEVRRTRLNSEELADRGAALAVGEDIGISLFDYLNELDTNPDKRHPSSQERIKYLRRYT